MHDSRSPCGALRGRVMCVVLNRWCMTATNSLLMECPKAWNCPPKSTGLSTWRLLSEMHSAGPELSKEPRPEENWTLSSACTSNPTLPSP